MTMVAPVALALSPPRRLGQYEFSANGWDGKLTIREAWTGWASAVMHYDELGRDEQLNGDWQPSSGTLTLYRPLPWGNSQTYTLYLGNHDRARPMFGGYFTQSDVPGRRFGAYAARNWQPHQWDPVSWVERYPIGDYALNATAGEGG
jgi:hypothetical protein